MNDKVNTVVIGKLIKENFNGRVKHLYGWQTSLVAIAPIYIRYTIALPSIRACCSTSVKS